MDKQHVLQRLEGQKRRLRERGVVGLSLFGSTARGEATPESDIDYFTRLEALREELSVLLGMPVDLLEEPVAAKELQARIDEDRSIAFQ